MGPDIVKPIRVVESQSWRVEIVNDLLVITPQLYCVNVTVLVEANRGKHFMNNQ